MGQSCHGNSCITGFLLNTEAPKLKTSGGNSSNLGLRSHYKTKILLAINHLILQIKPENEEGGYILIFLFLNFSKKETVFKKKKKKKAA